MKIERNILFSCTELPEKEKRNLLIFDLIRKRGLISKPEISKITGINIVSVTNYVENYIAKKLISERDSEVSSGGRKPELVELNRKDRCVVGMEIGGDGVYAALTDLGMKPIAKAGPVRTKADDTAAVSASMEDALQEIVKKADRPLETVGAIGIGMADSRLVSALEAVGRRLGLHVFAGGSAHCAAFGERTLNAVVDDDDILYMHSDLGRGIVIKGCVCYGAVGSAAEIEVAAKDPVRLEKDGYDEELAYLHPWSPRLGAVAVAKAEVCRGVGTKIVDAAHGRADTITLSGIIEASRAKDKVACDILKTIGINLGVRTAYLVNVFSPKTVVIGGGIDKAGDLVLGPIQNMVKRFSFKKQAARVKIIPGILGDDAVSMGAAALAVREVFLRA